MARSVSVELLRERLAGHCHLVNPEIRVVANQLPGEPAVCIEREAAAPAVVTGVGRTGGIAGSQWLSQAAWTAAREPTAARPLKAAVPSFDRQRKEHLD